MREENTSQFAKKLASDGQFASRCSSVAECLRDAASEDVQAVDRAEHLTREDYAVYINARADNSLPDPA